MFICDKDMCDFIMNFSSNFPQYFLLIKQKLPNLRKELASKMFRFITRSKNSQYVLLSDLKHSAIASCFTSDKALLLVL